MKNATLDIGKSWVARVIFGLILLIRDSPFPPPSMTSPPFEVPGKPKTSPCGASVGRGRVRKARQRPSRTARSAISAPSGRTSSDVQSDALRAPPVVHCVDPPIRQISQRGEVLRPGQRGGLEPAHGACRGRTALVRPTTHELPHHRIAAK